MSKIFVCFCLFVIIFEKENNRKSKMDYFSTNKP